ncbi:MAG: hypothetical protein V7609_371 [Verrucomicrobiota bacterium]
MNTTPHVYPSKGAFSSKAASWAIGLVLTCCSVSRGQDIRIINFEGIGDGTPITEQYANLGVHFSSATILVQDVGLNPVYPPHSGSGVVYDNPSGTITILFDTPQSKVGGYITGNRVITLKAYDASGTVLGTVDSPGANYIGSGTGLPPNIPLEVVSVSGDIAQVTFSDHGNSFTLDDLYFEAGPSIKITLDPSPLNDRYVIDASPKMPEIKARARVAGILPDPTATTRFQWEATLATHDGKGNTIDLSSSIIQNQTTTGETLLTLSFTPGSVFRGGNLVLKVRATVAGKELIGQTPTDLVILGTNPMRANIQRYIDAAAADGFFGVSGANVADTLKRIATRESIGQRQFDESRDGGVGDTLVAPDNGVGIFQITKTTKCPNGPFADTKCLNTVFDWQENINIAVANFKEKLNVAKNYPGNLEKNSVFIDYINSFINPARVAKGLKPIDKILVPSLTTIGIIGSSEPNQLLEDAVRGYNGYGSSTLVLNGKNTGILAHEFVPDETFLLQLGNNELQSLHKNPRFWIRFPAAQRLATPDKEYVAHIIASSPAGN